MASSSAKPGAPMMQSNPAPSTPPPPPPLTPTSYLAPKEQRWCLASIFGLLEVTKVWDILAPYFISDLEPTWSSALRLRGPFTALLWVLFETSAVAGVSLLRIPMLSPSFKQFVQIAGLTVAWNLACWFVSEPGAFFVSVNLVGPAALGGEWYWSWWYAAKRWQEPAHLEGRHTIRLLPHSTATLNPLSLSYCIPPGSPQPLYIPVVFNNSIPDHVTYYLRSLDTGLADVKTVAGSSMKRSGVGTPRLQIANDDEDEEDASEPEPNPLSALVLRSQSGELEVAKIPSVKPSDSLAVVPQGLEASQNLRFLTVDRPSVVSLKSVTDKRGDRFHITPHREAIIIECPTCGTWVQEDQKGKVTKKGDNKQPAQQRCVGDEDVAQFQARGVGSLRASWRKKSKDSTQSGVIEGIEDEIESVNQLALVRRDRMSKTRTVPFRVTHDKPGIFTVTLTGVTDSLHNSYTPSGYSAEKVYNVLPRPSARFDCPGVRELLLGKTTTISVILDESATPVDVIYSFESTEGKASTNSLKVSKRTESIPVSEPGVFTLLDIQGQCGGNILEPATCVVQLVPPPTVQLQVTTLHECAMDVGVTAAFDFTGSPPFVMEYIEQRQGGRASTRTANFKGFRGEMTMQPDHEGQYTYTLTTLSDGKYSRITLDKPPIQQIVHPLANVDVSSRGIEASQRKLFACSGDQVDLEIDAKGAGPLKLTYLRSWSGKADNVTIDIPTGQSKVSIPVPSELSANSGASGKLSIALSSIEDRNGCVRKLSATTVNVDIQRQRPTVRFARSEKVIITEGEVARAGLRLTGEPPWEVTYAVDGGADTKVTMRDPNNQLSFDQKGIYRLSQIRDLHCPGIIFENDSVFQVDFKPRPVVRIIETSSVTLAGDIYRHEGLCASEKDQVALHFSGQSPYELEYRHTSEGHTAKHTLKSAQETGILHLATEPGHHRYDLSELKDSNYPTTAVSIVLEHDVYSRPSVSFVNPNTDSICLDQPLRGETKVQLRGKAPFILTLTVREPASTKLDEHHIQVDGYEWTLELPHIMREIGRHEITIISVSDSSGCDQIINESDRLTTTVDVVESARIVPATQQTDLCVGDTLDFLLQGKAPWTIEYEWVGKRHKVTSPSSRFSRYAEEKGLFAVKSVALKDNQCKREIEDLERRVHPMPSVKIQGGLDSLRDGDEPAVFGVTFSGNPPFSFTYTRSEQVGSRSKIMETQTVTDIWSESYTISSSSPGDYAVTSVSDKYCRYPPLSRARKDT